MNPRSGIIKQESDGSSSASKRHGGVGTVQMLQGSATE